MNNNRHLNGSTLVWKWRRRRAGAFLSAAAAFQRKTAVAALR